MGLNYKTNFIGVSLVLVPYKKNARDTAVEPAFARKSSILNLK